MFSLQELEAAAELVHSVMPPTPQYAWPLLGKRLGAEVFVKHENHTPVGAFKIRGGIVFMDGLKRSGAAPNGVITATRGNHGQSIAMAGSRLGIPVTILVPHGNSREKNAAMRAFGAELIEFGEDFDEAKQEAARLADDRGLYLIPSFHDDLVKGVATYALEFFRAVPDLDAVYVPIGMGSGICGLITARDLLGLETEIIGVVAEKAPAVALSYAAGHVVPTNSARTFADGMACREPHPGALEIISKGAARIMQVSEDEVAAAMRILYQDTHNVAEGAGAAALAALRKDLIAEAGTESGENGRDKPRLRAGIVLTGGNVDLPVFSDVLRCCTPAA